MVGCYHSAIYFIIYHSLFCKTLNSAGKVFLYFFIVVRVLVRIYCFKMSSHQTSINKPRSSKCCHFCFAFDTHNYCPSCREAGKGDDPCVTNEKPCNICSAFTEEQLIKIKHRHRYVRKQKVSDTCNTSKDDELDLLG